MPHALVRSSQLRQSSFLEFSQPTLHFAQPPERGRRSQPILIVKAGMPEIIFPAGTS